MEDWDLARLAHRQRLFEQDAGVRVAQRLGQPGEVVQRAGDGERQPPLTGQAIRIGEQATGPVPAAARAGNIRQVSQRLGSVDGVGGVIGQHASLRRPSLGADEVTQEELEPG